MHHAMWVTFTETHCCTLVLHRFFTGQVDATYVYVAWVFVAFRALHSAAHCTFNLVMLRFYHYLIATLAAWFMVVRAVLTHLGR